MTIVERKNVYKYRKFNSPSVCSPQKSFNKFSLQKNVCASLFSNDAVEIKFKTIQMETHNRDGSIHLLNEATHFFPINTDVAGKKHTLR